VFDISVSLNDGWDTHPILGSKLTFSMDLLCKVHLDLDRNLWLMLLSYCPSASRSGPVRSTASQDLCLSSRRLNPSGNLARDVYGGPDDYSLVMQRCQGNSQETFKFDWKHRQIKALVDNTNMRCLTAGAGTGRAVMLSECVVDDESQQFWSNATAHQHGANTLSLSKGWDSSRMKLDCIEVDLETDLAGQASSDTKRMRLRECQEGRSPVQTFMVPWKLCNVGQEWFDGLSEGQRKQLERGASICGDFSYGGGLYAFFISYVTLLVIAGTCVFCICSFRGGAFQCCPCQDRKLKKARRRKRRELAVLSVK